MSTKGPTFRVFELFDISDLSRRTKYSEGHLVNVKEGSVPAGPRFRQHCALCLGLPETELFAPAQVGAEAE